MSHSERAGDRVRGWIGASLGAVVLLTTPGGASAAYTIDLPDELQNATYVGDSECLDCHDANPASHYRGFHADLQNAQLPGSTLGCESCHGPASMHVESEDPSHIINPATADVQTANGLCASCHRSGHLDGFQSSLHGMNDVACVACHTTHGDQNAGLLKAAEFDLCTSCHDDMRMRSYLPSRHPVREGKMTCSDCHDPHADAYATAFAGERNVDLCLDCHAGKQGPFVFEHAPVVEDCMICHDPHGAVANAMLKQNEPFLCLQCHQTHFHSTLQGIEGTFTTLDGYSGVSHRNSSKATFLTKCTQCHSEVHGSDHPSQSISGQGQALTR